MTLSAKLICIALTFHLPFSPPNNPVREAGQRTSVRATVWDLHLSHPLVASPAPKHGHHTGSQVRPVPYPTPPVTTALSLPTHALAESSSIQARQRQQQDVDQAEASPGGRTWRVNESLSRPTYLPASLPPCDWRGGEGIKAGFVPSRSFEAPNKEWCNPREIYILVSSCGTCFFLVHFGKN